MSCMRILAPALAAALLLGACVTINVYFPAAAAEKAADAIIEEVWGVEPEADTDMAPEPEAALPSSDWVRRFAELLIPAAHAQANLEIDTPAINRLKASMRVRHLELEPYYNAGAAGLTRDGMIAVRDAKLVALADRNRLKQLVAAENADRGALYRELAAANGHPEWEDNIRATFAERWIDKAPGGWWYETGSGWRQK